MKVKEKYSNDFKKDTYPKQIILKEKGDILLLETIKQEGELFYSSYNLYDGKYNESYIQFFLPNPKESEETKTFLLKYQHGMRTFLKDFFDVYVGDKNDIKPMYKTKQKKDMKWELSENDISVLLKLNESDKLVGIIHFDHSTKERNMRVARSIVKYFEGIPINSSWGRICEQ